MNIKSRLLLGSAPILLLILPAIAVLLAILIPIDFILLLAGSSLLPIRKLLRLTGDLMGLVLDLIVGYIAGDELR